ncbi:unnamed protein product [Urochloa humidicola]
MAARLMEEDPYAYVHRIRGAPEQRPDHVFVGVPRSDDIRQAERDLEIFSLMAVQINGHARFETEEVRKVLVRQLRVPVHELGVSRVSEASFLLRFDSRQQKNDARRLGFIEIGHTKLSLLPWSRRIGGTRTRFMYRVRLCIEGISKHARQIEIVGKLLNDATFIDEFNCPKLRQEEEICVCLWAWTSDPDRLAKEATLQVAEPVTLPEEGYAGFLEELGVPTNAIRSGAPGLLEYNVLIHLDCVEDYTSPPSSPSRVSEDSYISGVPNEDDDAGRIVRHPFLWYLGVPDGADGARRVPVHERLGGRGRPRSPPRGGGQGDMGLWQRPPSGAHDLGGAFGGPRFHQGGSSRGGGGGGGGNYQHRRCDLSSGTQFVWKAKGSARTEEVGSKKLPASQLSADWEAGDSFLLPDRRAPTHCLVDPMVEEAERSLRPRHRQPMLLQRSVEPTATDGPQELPGLHVRGKETVLQSDQTGGVPDALSVVKMVPQTLEVQEHAELITTELVGLNTVGVTQGFGRGAANSVQSEQEKMKRVPARSDGPAIVGLDCVDGPADGCTTAIAGLDCAASVGPEGMNGPVEGASKAPLFDLNVGCGDGSCTLGADSARIILGGADARLNKEKKTMGGPKAHAKGMARFAVPLKKSLLCNPPVKCRTGQGKKCSVLPAGPVKISTATSAPTSTMSIEDKATSLLLEAGGIISKGEAVTADGEEQFGERFVEHITLEMEGEMRKVFGLNVGGAGERLNPLALDAEE